MKRDQYLTNPQIRSVLERFWEGGIAKLSDVNPGMVDIDGEPGCRTSLIHDLLRTGLIEVAGAKEWKGKTCPMCGGVKPPDFSCCEEVYC